MHKPPRAPLPEDPWGHPWDPDRLISFAPTVWSRAAISLSIELPLSEKTIISIRKDDLDGYGRMLCVGEIVGPEEVRVGWYPLSERTTRFLVSQYQHALRARSKWLFPGSDPAKHINVLDFINFFRAIAMAAGYHGMPFSDLYRLGPVKAERDDEPPF